MQALKISPDKSDESCIFFVWPLEIVHVIDEDSPFYDVTATELPKHKFELVAVLEGPLERGDVALPGVCDPIFLGPCHAHMICDSAIW